MSVQIVLDVTNEYNSGSESGTPYLVKLDIGGFDYAVVQLVNNSGTAVDFFSTNDSGDIQGVSDGSAVSSANTVIVQGVNLSTGAATNSISADALIRFQSIGRYLWVDGTGDETELSKLLVRLYKIH